MCAKVLFVIRSVSKNYVNLLNYDWQNVIEFQIQLTFYYLVNFIFWFVFSLDTLLDCFEYHTTRLLTGWYGQCITFSSNGWQLYLRRQMTCQTMCKFSNRIQTFSFVFICCLISVHYETLCLNHSQFYTEMHWKFRSVVILHILQFCKFCFTLQTIFCSYLFSKYLTNAISCIIFYANRRNMLLYTKFSTHLE